VMPASALSWFIESTHATNVDAPRYLEPVRETVPRLDDIEIYFPELPM
jgi:hypothetical protein